MKHSSFIGPVNIGSEEKVTINDLVDIAARVAGKQISRKHIPGPVGVRGRNSDNTLIKKMLDWNYQQSLEVGIEKTYNWFSQQVKEAKNKWWGRADFFTPLTFN